MSNFLLKINVIVKTFMIFVFAFLFLTISGATVKAVDEAKCGINYCTCAMGNPYDCVDTDWNCQYGDSIVFCSNAVCGNNILENGEICDGSNFGSLKCSDYGYQGGTLLCTSACTLDFSQCEEASFCGNGIVEGAEQCDAGNLNGQTCASLGAGSGTLTCNSNCTFNTSNCVVCGNGVVEVGEQCDAGNLNGQTCERLGYDYGILGCVDSLCVFNTLLCYYNNYNLGERCGDGIINGSEQCEFNEDCPLDLVCASCMCRPREELDTETTSMGCESGADPVPSDWSDWKTGTKPCPDCGTAHEKIFTSKPWYNLCKGTDFVGPVYVGEEYYPEYSNYYYWDRETSSAIYEPSHSDVLAKWIWTCQDSSGWSKECEAYPRSECNTEISAQERCDSDNAPLFNTEQAFKDKRDEKTEYDRYCNVGRYNVWPGAIQPCDDENSSWDVTFDQAWRCVGYSSSEQLGPGDDNGEINNNVDCSAHWAGLPECGYLNNIENNSTTDEYWVAEDSNSCWNEAFFSLNVNTEYTRDFSNAFCNFDGRSYMVGAPILTQIEGIGGLPGTATWTWTCLGQNNQTVQCSTSINDTCLDGVCGTDNGLTFPNEYRIEPGGYGGDNLCIRGNFVKNGWPVLDNGVWHYNWTCQSSDGATDDECSATAAGKCGPASSYYNDEYQNHTIKSTRYNEPAIVTNLNLSDLCQIGNLVNLGYSRSRGCGERGNAYLDFMGGTASDNLCRGVWSWACGTAEHYEECQVVESYPLCGYAHSADPDIYRFSTAQEIDAYGLYGSSGYGDCLRGNDPDMPDGFILDGSTWRWVCDIQGSSYSGDKIKFFLSNTATVSCDARYGQ